MPQSVTHVDYAMKKHTKKRGALGNAQMTQATKRDGKKVYEKDLKGSFQSKRSQRESHEKQQSGKKAALKKEQSNKEKELGNRRPKKKPIQGE